MLRISKTELIIGCVRIDKSKRPRIPVTLLLLGNILFKLAREALCFYDNCRFKHGWLNKNKCKHHHEEIHIIWYNGSNFGFSLQQSFRRSCIQPQWHGFINKSVTTNGSKEVATTTTFSLNNKVIYNIISNAVANGNTFDPDLVTTTLPSNGYIAYNFFATNITSYATYDPSYSQVVGAFYVTNKTGFYYPLSGLDTAGNYYSFMELDTWDSQYGQLGFSYDFNPLASYSVNNGNGSETDTDTALLYINDDPELYDDADFPNSYIYNNNSIEIRGILKLSLTVKNGFISKGSASLSGSGNILTIQSGYGAVTTGTMKLQ